tara:strand:+ start:774 stop:953 length:180 start_codon:yes stop_codon:yes gene_type:complete
MAIFNFTKNSGKRKTRTLITKINLTKKRWRLLIKGLRRCRANPLHHRFSNKKLFIRRKI